MRVHLNRRGGHGPFLLFDINLLAPAPCAQMQVCGKGNEMHLPKSEQAPDQVIPRYLLLGVLVSIGRHPEPLCSSRTTAFGSHSHKY
jgi:hypothetical protein